MNEITYLDQRLNEQQMANAVEEAELLKFALLKPTLTQDGNQWCVLYGENLQTGIAGFGDTPYQAIQAWNAEWHKKAERPKVVDNTPICEDMMELGRLLKATQT